MFDLPDTYKVDVKVALKDFIPNDLKPNDKKRIKDAVKSVRLINVNIKMYIFDHLKMYRFAYSSS